MVAKKGSNVKIATVNSSRYFKESEEKENHQIWEAEGY